MRSATCERKTSETDVRVELAVDGTGRCAIETGIAFFDHMLETLAFHARFDLALSARGDLKLDPHHTVEDTGIVLGQALGQALGGKKGIERAGFFLFPMDEALATAAVDLCGRFHLHLDCPCAEPQSGAFAAPLLHEFLWSFAFHVPAVFHLRVQNGRTFHHQAEVLFKALGRALSAACTLRATERELIPSCKGSL